MASNLLVLLIHIVLSWTVTEGKSKLKTYVSLTRTIVLLIGQLVEEQRAICHNDISIYRCTNNQSGFLIVEFKLVSGERFPVSFNKVLTPEGTLRNVVVGSSTVIANITSIMESFISVTFTILNPVSLNGTTILCNGDTIQMIVASRNGSKSMHSHKHTNMLTLLS